MRIIEYIKRKFGARQDDGYDRARENAALECIKTGKSIMGKIYPDGRVVVEKVVENEGGSGMETLKGKVKWFDAKKGFGFIEAGGKDYFVHFSSIKSEGYRKLVDGEEVEFEIGTTPKGECAVNVVRISPPVETERKPRAPRESREHKKEE